MWTFLADHLAEAERLQIQARSLSIQEVEDLRRDLVAKYAQGGGRTWPLWDRSGDAPSVHDPSAWQWIGEYLGEAPVTLLWNPEDERGALRLERGSDLTKLLGETYHTEFYVTDQRTSYALCFNHHDVLIAFGEAASWLRGRAGPR